MRFAHCSDIHLLDLTGWRLRQFANKRLTGAMNLWLKRSKGHDGQRFDVMLEQARQLGAERLVITGDLTNLALDSEFLHVRTRLESAGLPVTLIPGNHDVYTQGSARVARFEQHLAQFMDGERPAGLRYPYVQHHPDVVFVGLSTAIPRPPLVASGKLGQEQLKALDQVLAALKQERKAVVVLLHHPPLDGQSHARHDLLDRAAFREVLARHGADLVLHGHEHRVFDLELPGPVAAIPVHGIGSATSTSPKPHKRGSFAMVEIEHGSLIRSVYEWSGSQFQARGEVP